MHGREQPAGTLSNPLEGATRLKNLSIADCRRKLRHGLIPAVPVPFRSSGELDPKANEQYVEHMAAQQIAGVAVWAHTGRGLWLKQEERVGVLRTWSEGLGQEQILIAGAGGSSEHVKDSRAYVSSALRMAGDALENGAGALLAFPPLPLQRADGYDDSVLDYHKQLAGLGAPLILFYLYEAAGGITYSPSLLRELLALPEVVGIKLATLNSVMTYQDVAAMLKREFPEKLLLTGEDRFLGYSLMCGADAALIGMGASCTALQRSLMDAYFDGRAAEFLALSQTVDELARLLFRAPMEGYIHRVLWALVHEGVIARESGCDPWGPPLPKGEFEAIGEAIRRLAHLEQTQRIEN